MSAAKSDYLKAKVLDLPLGAQTWTPPGSVYIALMTTRGTNAQSSANTNFTEVSGGSYARVAVTNNLSNWPAASSGSKSNGNAITYPTATASWGTVVCVNYYDASTSGNLLYWQDLGGEDKYATVAASSDTFTSASHGFANATKLRFAAITGLSLPSGISAGTTYYVINTATNTFQVSLTQGGAAVDVTADGAGIFYQDNSRSITTGDQVSFAASNLTVKEV